MSLDSAPLIDRAQKGDVLAFQELICPHVETVRRLARSFARDWSDADDVAQEALLKAFRSLPTFRGDSSFSTWLYHVTKNSCIDWYRSKYFRTREREAQELEHIVSSELSQEQLLRQRDRAEVLWQAIHSLDATFKVPLVLCEIEGMSYEAIAQIERVPVGTVRSRLNRAKKHLVAALEETDEFARVTPLPPTAGTSDPDLSSMKVRVLK